MSYFNFIVHKVILTQYVKRSLVTKLETKLSNLLIVKCYFNSTTFLWSVGFYIHFSKPPKTSYFMFYRLEKDSKESYADGEWGASWLGIGWGFSFWLVTEGGYTCTTEWTGCGKRNIQVSQVTKKLDTRWKILIACVKLEKNINTCDCWVD